MSTHHGRNDASGLQFVLLLDEETAPLAVLSRRPRARARDRLLLRVRSYSLDVQLAAGRSPDDERMRAIRADALVSPRTRRTLARHWERIISAAGSSRWDPRLPLSPRRVLSAESEIRRLVHALRDPSPVPARGVAMASVLLADGTGPLYNGYSGRTLEDALREAIRHLDPTTTLLSH